MLTNRSLATADRMLSLNRVLDEALRQSFGTASAPLWVPPMDVAERADAYLLHLELPGVNPDQVELHFEQNVLTIRGTKPSAIDPKTDGELRLHARERVSGSFERSIRLPEFVDGDHIDASFHNGLLSIVIPTAQAAQPRRIEIRSGVTG